MAWTDVFGGQTINPQSISYAAYEFDADATFLWPTTAATGNVVTDIMDITTTAAGVTLTMPDARRAGPGQASLIYNAGGETFSVVSATGVAIQSIAPGEGWYVWMRDNSTESGQWRTVQFGAGTSSASAAALASQTVKASGSALVQAMPVFAISSDFTVGENERGKLVNWTGGTGTLTLTAAGTLGDDWFAFIRNSGTGTITVDVASGGTIDGNSSLTLNTNEGALFVSTGTAYFSALRTIEAVDDFTLTSISVAGSGDFTLSSGQLGFSSYVFTGTLTGNRNIIVPATVAPYRVRNNTTGSFTLTVKTASGTGVVVEQANGKFLVCDGTNVIDQVTPGIATPIAISDGGTGATSASSARTNLGATSVGNALFTAASESAGRDAIGLGTAATQNDDRYAHRANNLSDLASASSARSNLGLGTAALVNVGTSNGNVPVLGSDGKFDEGVLPEIASDAFEIDYDDSVTNFGLDPADLNVQKAIEAAAASGGGKELGEVFFVWDHLSGVGAPDNSEGEYIRLTAGQSGSGGYNEGLLTNESVSGSAPLVEATAEIATGPLEGQVVHLINTEEAFLRARETSGELQMDQMQRITGEKSNRDTSGTTKTGAFVDGTSVSGQISTVTTGSSNELHFDSSQSPDARTSSTTSGETRSKNVSGTAYMRIA